MYSIFNESEDIAMDVQVGPEKEIRAETKDSPVVIAKKNPDTVCVAGKENADGVCEFFVDADDVINFARLNEESILEAMNQIIDCNESAGVSAQNLIMIMNESNMGYAKELEARGATCMRIVDEEEVGDISMDVQVGPNGDEVRVSEDPQEANPVDAVKRQYDTVVVAKDGDNFFTDAEDVQKCADLNCESVIETLNGIISANESAGVEASNLVVMVSENVDCDTVEKLEEAGVSMIDEASKEKRAETKTRKSIMRKVAKIINDFFKDNNARTASTAASWWFNQNSKFIHGKSDVMEFNVREITGTTSTLNSGFGSGVQVAGNMLGSTLSGNMSSSIHSNPAEYQKALGEDIKAFNKNKSDLEKAINKELAPNNKVKNLNINRDAKITMTLI